MSDLIAHALAPVVMVAALALTEAMLPPIKPYPVKQYLPKAAACIVVLIEEPRT